MLLAAAKHFRVMRTRTISINTETPSFQQKIYLLFFLTKLKTKQKIKRNDMLNHFERKIVKNVVKLQSCNCIFTKKKKFSILLYIYFSSRNSKKIFDRAKYNKQHVRQM